jgi:hypothetical protein
MKYGDVTRAQEEALLDKIGGVKGMHKILSGDWIVGTPQSVKPAKTKLLRTVSRAFTEDLLLEVGQPTSLEGCTRFVAREKWIVNSDGEVPISHLGHDIINNFLDLIEENVPPTRVRQRKLRKKAENSDILAALGEKDLYNIEKTCISFAHVYEFLKTADRTSWFIFYVFDVRGTCWELLFGWENDGWDACEYAVTHPGKWEAGVIVISR